MKKVIALFLSLLLCISSLNGLDSIAFAATATTYTYENYKYTIIDSKKKTVKITQYLGNEENVRIPEFVDNDYKVLELGANSFRSTGTKSIYISKYIEAIEPIAFECDYLKEIIVDEENESFTSRDGVLYSKDMKTLVRFPVSYGKEKFYVPDTVEVIGEKAFRGPFDTSVTPEYFQIEFSEGLKEIGFSAFSRAYIKEIRLPESVTKINNFAFLDVNAVYLYIGGNVETIDGNLFCTTSGTSNCKIKTIEVSEENEIFSSEDNVLFGDYGRELLYYPKTKKNKTYIVPDKVEKIGRCAFCFLSMDCVDLNNVKTLDNYAFFNVSIKKYILSQELEKFRSNEHNTSFEIVSLNPNCDISLDISSYTNHNIKIYGYIGSTAENYVNEKCSDKLNLTFISIDGEEPENYHLPMPVAFGSYPQKKVASNALSSKLSALDLQWHSYGYYSGNGKQGSQEKGDYMQYADVIYNGSKYRGVKLSQYRPIRSYLASTENYSYQDDNGYFTNNVYWFKYEPIEWVTLDKTSGLVTSCVALDSQSFCNSTTENSNDYSQSSLRIWLNNDFYNTAFTDEEKNLINSSNLSDIGAVDKIHILSYDDVLKTDFGFTSNANSTPKRYCVGSDYAQCQGLMVKTNTDVNNYYESNANWLLRTAGTSYDLICNVTVEGKLAQNHSIYNCDGIRPTLCLSTISGNTNTECQHTSTKVLGYIAASCTRTGYSGDVVCSICGITVENGMVIPVKEHIFSLKDRIEPTCSQQGTVTYICSECGQLKEESLEMLEHTISEDKGYAPTCTQDGLTDGSHCSQCNTIIKPQTTIDATGHTVVTDNAIAATYSTSGLTSGSHCIVCNTVIKEQSVIPAIICNHSTTKTVVLCKASFSQQGDYEIVCTTCGKSLSKGVTRPVKSIKLSKTKLVYTGKVLSKPKVKVVDVDGNIINSDNYKIKYISRSTGKKVKKLKKIGQYKALITFKGKYSGSKELYFTVNPKKGAVKKLSTSSKSITAKWKKDKNVSGYQVVIATNSKFTKNKKTVKISKNSTTSYKFKKLKKGKKYYVKVRAYKNVKVDGKKATVYGAYSKPKSISCK